MPANGSDGLAAPRTVRGSGWRWRDLPVKAKGVVAVSIPVVGLLLTALVFQREIQTESRLDEARMHAVDVRSAVRITLVTVLEGEVGVRGYLLTGHPVFLDPYREARASLPLDIRRLRSLIPGGEELAHFRSVDELVRRRLALLDALVASEPGPGRQEMLEQGRRLSEQLQSELEALLALENRRVEAIDLDVARHSRETVVVVWVGAGLGLIGGLVAVGAFTASVVRRIHRVESNADRMIRGLPLEPVPGRDEIGHLGRAMHAASDRLARTRGLLRGVVEGTTDSVFVKDLQGRYLMMNQAGAEFRGRPVDEIVGRTDAELYPPEEARAFLEADRRVIESGQVEMFEGEAEKDGEMRAFLATKGPIRDGSGRVTGVFGISRDVTERHRMEQAIRERERRFRTLTQLAPVGIFQTDAEGKGTFMNERCSEIVGLRSEEAMGKRWTRAIHPEDRDEVMEAWRRATAAVESFDREVRFVPPDGAVRWVLTNAVPLKDEDGTGVGYLGTVLDVTDRWRAERERDQFFDLAADLFAVVGADGRFQRLNQAWPRTLGWSEEELMASPSIEFVHPEDREATERETGRVAEGASTLSFANRYRTKNGDYRWLVWNAVPFPEDHVIYAIARDVTDQKQRPRIWSGSTTSSRMRTGS